MDEKTHKPAADAQSSSTPGKDLLMASLDMSWRLAIVVLVPIIGGFELDKLLGTLPALTIIGFLIAMTGMTLVVWLTLKKYNS